MKKLVARGIKELEKQTTFKTAGDKTIVLSLEMAKLDFTNKVGVFLKQALPGK